MINRKSLKLLETTKKVAVEIREGKPVVIFLDKDNLEIATIEDSFSGQLLYDENGNHFSEHME